MGQHEGQTTIDTVCTTMRAKVNIKTVQSQISLILPVVHVSSISLVQIDTELLSFHTIPQEVVEEMAALASLVSATESSVTVTNKYYDQIVEARLSLQKWFNEDLGFRGYKLRHIIPRSTRAQPPQRKIMSGGDDDSDNNNQRQVTHIQQQQRKSFAIQKPVLRFHTDSTHTAFTNIWLPIQVTGYHLGFLCHPDSGCLVTGKKVEEVCSSSMSNEQTRSFFQSCCVIHHPDLTYGQAIVFRSGGCHGIMHGSFEVIGQDEQGHRESVEFRCQRFNSQGDWIYGDIDE
jgi:hypothetical protein